MATVGEAILKCRKDAGLTQEQLAKMVGTTKQTIYKYEHEVVTNVPLSTIKKIAKVFGKSPADLMGWEAKNPPAISDEGKLDVTDLTDDNVQKVKDYIDLLLNAQHNS